MAVNNHIKLEPEEEKQFQTWYKGQAEKANIDPNPDHPLHKYDYRAAYKAGVTPVIDPQDGQYHWPSEFKDDDHPNRFVDGIDTKTGTNIKQIPEWEQWQKEGFSQIPYEKQREVLDNYFTKNMATPEFINLSPEAKVTIREKFIKTHIGESPAVKDDFGNTAYLAKHLGIGLARTGQLMGRGLDIIGLDSAGGFVEDVYKEREKKFREDLANSNWRDVDEKTFFTKDEEGNRHMGEAWTSPMKIAGMITESAPSMALAMGGSVAITEGLIARGVSKTLAGILGGAISEGGVAGAEASKNAYDLVYEAPTESLQKTDEYKKLAKKFSDLDPLLRDKTIREVMARAAAIKTGLISFTGNAIFGAPSGAFMGKVLKESEITSAAGKIFIGGFLEALEEMPQEALDTIVENANIKAYIDPSHNLWTGVDEAIVAGGITGFTAGAGTHASLAAVSHVSPENLLKRLKDSGKGFKLDESEIVKPDKSKAEAVSSNVIPTTPEEADAQYKEYSPTPPKSQSVAPKQTDLLADQVKPQTKQSKSDVLGSIQKEQEALEEQFKAQEIRPDAYQFKKKVLEKRLENVQKNLKKYKITADTILNSKGKLKTAADMVSKDLDMEINHDGKSLKAEQFTFKSGIAIGHTFEVENPTIGKIKSKASQLLQERQQRRTERKAQYSSLAEVQAAFKKRYNDLKEKKASPYWIQADEELNDLAAFSEEFEAKGAANQIKQSTPQERAAAVSDSLGYQVIYKGQMQSGDTVIDSYQVLAGKDRTVQADFNVRSGDSSETTLRTEAKKMIDSFANVESDPLKSGKAAEVQTQPAVIPESEDEQVDFETGDDLLSGNTNTVRLINKDNKAVDLPYSVSVLETPPSDIAKSHPQAKEAYEIVREMKARQSHMFSDSIKPLKKFFNLNKMETVELSDLIFELEGKKIKGLPEKFIILDGELALNAEHYTKLKEFLINKGVKSEVVDAYLSLRESLDEDLTIIDRFIAQDKDQDAGAIERYRDEVGRIHNYFPHARFGKHFIEAVEIDPETGKGEVIYREHFDIPIESAKVEATIAKNKIAELKEQYPGAEWNYGKIPKLPDEAYNVPIPVAAMDQIFQRAFQNLEKTAGTADIQFIQELKKVFPEAVGKILKTKGFKSHLTTRKNIPGFDQVNIKKVLFQYKSGLYNTLGKMQAAQKAAATMNKINFAEQPRLWKFTDGYFKDQFASSDSLDRANQIIKGVIAIKYLGFRLPTAVINSFQNLVLGIPRLNMDLALTDSGILRLLRAAGSDLYDFYINSKNRVRDKYGYKKLRRTIPEDEQALIRLLEHDGTLMSQFLDEYSGKSDVGLPSMTRKVMNVMFWPLAVVERFNRASLALAAFRVAKEGKITRSKMLAELGLQKGQKADFDTAARYAKLLTDDAHLVYGRANRPAMIRGNTKMFSPMYTFLTYPHQVTHMYKNLLIREGLAGRIAFAHSVGMLAALGGVASIPGYKAFMAFWRQTFGDDPTEEYILKNIENSENGLLQDLILYGLPAVAGPAVGKVFNKDIPGVTFSSSLSLNPPLLSEADLSKTYPEIVQDGMAELLGAPWSVLVDTSRAIEAYKYGGGVDRVLEHALPSALGNVLKAKRLLNEGYSTITGKPYGLPGDETPRKLTLAEARLQALGFTPVSSAKAHEIYKSLEDRRIFVESKKKEFASRYKNGTIPERHQVMKELQEWNASMYLAGKYEYLISLDRSIQDKFTLNQPSKQFRTKAQQLKKRYKAQ